jgi:hypothetical protein
MKSLGFGQEERADRLGVLDGTVQNHRLHLGGRLPHHLDELIVVQMPFPLGKTGGEKQEQFLRHHTGGRIHFPQRQHRVRRAPRLLLKFPTGSRLRRLRTLVPFSRGNLDTLLSHGVPVLLLQRDLSFPVDGQYRHPAGVVEQMVFPYRPVRKPNPFFGERPERSLQQRLFGNRLNHGNPLPLHGKRAPERPFPDCCMLLSREAPRHRRRRWRTERSHGPGTSQATP